METMLRLVNARNLALLAVLAVGASAARLYQGDLSRRYAQWRFPAQGTIDPLGRDILEAAEKREKERVSAMHARLLSLLAKSREEGFDTSSLEPTAAAALKLNFKERRPEAIVMLSKLEMDIPRKKVQYIPMNPEDEKVELPADVPSAPPKTHAPARKRKARRSRPVE